MQNHQINDLLQELQYSHNQHKHSQTVSRTDATNGDTWQICDHNDSYVLCFKDYFFGSFVGAWMTLRPGRIEEYISVAVTSTENRNLNHRLQSIPHTHTHTEHQNILHFEWFIDVCLISNGTKQKPQAKQWTNHGSLEYWEWWKAVVPECLFFVGFSEFLCV